MASKAMCVPFDVIPGWEKLWKRSPGKQQQHPFNGSLSRTTWVSWYQKGRTRKVKPIWIYWSKR